MRRSNNGLEEFDGLTPIGGEVVPGGVVALDQSDTSGAYPVFYLFLAADGATDVLILFEINQAVDFILPGESFDFAALVLGDTPLNVVGDSGVDSAGLARHDVDVEAVFAGHRFFAVEGKADPPRLLRSREG